MFDRLFAFAEQVATNVSRRRFLGRLGQTAAGVLGVLLLPKSAEASAHCNGQLCPPGYNFCCKVPDPIAPHNFVRVCSITPCK